MTKTNLPDEIEAMAEEYVTENRGYDFFDHFDSPLANQMKADFKAGAQAMLARGVASTREEAILAEEKHSKIAAELRRWIDKVIVLEKREARIVAALDMTNHFLKDGEQLSAKEMLERTLRELGYSEGGSGD